MTMARISLALRIAAPAGSALAALMLVAPRVGCGKTLHVAGNVHLPCRTGHRSAGRQHPKLTQSGPAHP